ncbi:D-alanine--D-alanine ligase [uncultured Cohaesibacter sp.]|uniref:D-alanine--D-alanine ligase n=1 Tax=uncultured Cohaesibacter sp. TaxID=1002546 RepID=UPI0029C8C5B6|nr:D-alanine--D-alanine ligase [uncultured Cohaesibacter sp.]
MTKHVAVLMGGWSSERPVSLSSGEECAKALEASGFKVTRIDVKRDVATVLNDLKPDVAFNALHGPYGEDGCIQGVLEFLGIPYTHSGVMASSLAMNKEKAKVIMKAAGIPVAESKVMHRLDAAKEHALPTPYVVKPVREGSSFGVLIVKEGQEHPPQELFSADWPYGDIVMVERYVAGQELTCAVMGDKALDIIDIVNNKPGFYDFDAKYAPGGSTHILPARLKPNIYEYIQSLTLTAHCALGCRGVSRVDFRYDETAGDDGDLICLEVNTQPGMTPTSLVPDMASHMGLSFEDLVTWMVEDASCDR